MTTQSREEKKMRVILNLDDNTKFLGLTLCVDEGNHIIECGLRAYSGDELYDGVIIDTKEPIPGGTK